MRRAKRLHHAPELFHRARPTASSGCCAPARRGEICPHDGQIADTLLDHLGPPTIVLADKAYDADRLSELIQGRGATPNIPPKSNRRSKPCFSKRLYRKRTLSSGSSPS